MSYLYEYNGNQKRARERAHTSSAKHQSALQDLASLPLPGVKTDPIVLNATTMTTTTTTIDYNHCWVNIVLQMLEKKY